MGYDMSEKEVSTFLKDKRLTSEIVKRVVSNKETLDKLAEDIADDLSDAIENYPTIKKQIVAAAMRDPRFKERVVRALVSEMSDDDDD